MLIIIKFKIKYCLDLLINLLNTFDSGVGRRGDLEDD